MRNFLTFFLLAALAVASIAPVDAQTRQGGNIGNSGFNGGGDDGPFRPASTNNRPDLPEAPVDPVEPLETDGQVGPQTPPPVRIVTRQVPYPVARPEFREIPYPGARPLLSLGRPALIDAAEFEPLTIVLLVGTEGAGDTIRALMADYGLTYVEADVLGLAGASLVKFRVPPENSVEEWTEILAADPRVIAVQPNYLFEVAQDTAPPDMRPMQYAPQRLHVPEAHNATLGSGVTVGVIDTAIDIAHPELASTSIQQFDVLDGDPVSYEHGTAMSGLIVAKAALDGVAPGVSLISVRAFDTNSRGAVSSSSFALAKALDRMAESGAEVLNLSFAGPRDPLVLEIMDKLEALDIPIIAAAGNNGPDAPPVYPAAHRHAIAVTATDDRDEAFRYANLGMYVEIAAPGVDILSPLPDGRYDLESGTSVATAHVTGIVALMLARNPDLTVAELRAALTVASLDLGAEGRDEVYGTGLINAALAVQAAGEMHP